MLVESFLILEFMYFHFRFGIYDHWLCRQYQHFVILTWKNPFAVVTESVVIIPCYEFTLSYFLFINAYLMALYLRVKGTFNSISFNTNQVLNQPFKPNA